MSLCFIMKALSGAFFNYVTGGVKAPPAPIVAPSHSTIPPPPPLPASQSPFSLKYKQSIGWKGRVCESYVLFFFLKWFNACQMLGS